MRALPPCLGEDYIVPSHRVRVEVAAAAAKLLQLCLTLQPHRRQPTRLRHPWDSPGKNTGVGCHFLLCIAIGMVSPVVTYRCESWIIKKAEH